MSISRLILFAALAGGSVAYVAAGMSADGATGMVAELGPLPICHTRIAREAPSVRLQRLAEMKATLPQI